MHLRFYAPRAACSLQLTMKRTVAIVEDEPAIRDNYAAAFTREGYVVRTYPNRSQAMTAFAARLPDLAVIDISITLRSHPSATTPGRARRNSMRPISIPRLPTARGRVKAASPSVT